MLRFLILCSTTFVLGQAVLRNAVQGTKCNKNQVVNKLTVYEDGAIEAECGPIPCGEAGNQCLEEQSACKAETDIFSGMAWAKNGQSLILRCCSMNVDNKIYVGTDLVTLGSYYTGGLVNTKDRYGNAGPEYDFIANARTEQGGVRIWVYRMICAQQNGQQKEQVQDPKAIPASLNYKQISESNDSPAETSARMHDAQEPAPIQNPLQYRPPRRTRQSIKNKNEGIKN